jgi:hypothetical protein
MPVSDQVRPGPDARMKPARLLILAGFALAAAAVALWRHPGGSPAGIAATHAMTRPAVAEATGSTQRLANPLERAADLRSVYERFRRSDSPAERNVAYRAWTACFPTFLAPAGQPVTLEAATRPLPPSAPNAARRIDAYRELFDRCHAFFDLPHDEIVAESLRQKNVWQSGLARAEGERVLQRFRQGDVRGAVFEARDIIASGDAYAIFSLHDFMLRYLSSPADRPDARALAFYLVPCELGMECGPESLTALQLCAGKGECSGSVAERYAHAFSAQVDRDALFAESRHVADAIRGGDFAALGL